MNIIVDLHDTVLSNKCPRVDAFRSASGYCVVHCDLPQNHEGPHTFTHTWRDSRDK